MFGFKKPKVNQEHLANIKMAGVKAKEAAFRVNRGFERAETISAKADKALNDFSSAIDAKAFDAFVLGPRVPQGEIQTMEKRIKSMRVG